VKRAVLAGKTLANDFRILVDQDGHVSVCFRGRQVKGDQGMRR
jgi:hypothetical protein